eukprot:XP_011616468.1 PREDICTED: Fanconi anemia group M protein isoform X2 [Takifugu rubripes]
MGPFLNLFPQQITKMSKGLNQRTLFQTWGGSNNQSKVVQPTKDGRKPAGGPQTTQSNTTEAAKAKPTGNPLWPEISQRSAHASEDQVRTEEAYPAFEDDDDDLMVVAVYEAEKSLQHDRGHSLQRDDSAGTGSKASPSTETYQDLPGFDSSSAKVWIYPTNYPIREYQLKMSEVALFQNTLVCLPTGLGKTFIASVVMYNFYRWYPSGKIVFMAPTKPLVAQQIEACYKVMGIPQAHMAELTGSTGAKQRQEIWRAKRVFFLTPQVMVNDLSRETCPAQQVKCVVIDEAHKALGNHAYCQVIRQLCSQMLQFRVLALTATPGGDAKSVQSVVSNLLISHIELRSDESPDIRAYSHQRSVEKVVVPLGEILSAHQARYLQVLEKFTSRLVQSRVMAHKDLRTLSKYQLILARDQFRKNPLPHIKGPQQGVLEGDFALCISLYHGYELLMQMGLRSLFLYFQGIMDGSREMSRARNELQRTPVFMDLYQEMEAMFVKQSAESDEPFIYSHPKLQKLEDVVLQHFRLRAGSSADKTDCGTQEVSTRVMIFSSFRESVQEIAAMLNRHAPLIRVMTFMGQASAGKGVKGFTQKEQLEVVHRFRQGGFNTLVSTCVGEEGLDIGEVDLIVCFDAQKNPTRLVQRMGRTGRKRQGRIVVILSEGREERTYNQSQSNKRNVYKSITGNKCRFHMYPSSPRMLPQGLIPTLHKMHITCGQFDHQESSRRSVRGRRSRSEGRASLIHPQNLIHQESTASDGFLSSAEFSKWASTVRLREDEPHPVLKQSQFVSLPADPPKDNLSKTQRSVSRELSLSEWRHWQHKSLPTHVINHSARCQHFIEVMELIDNMKEENEGECLYEQDLLPYLHQPDDHIKKGQKMKKNSKNCPKLIINKCEPPRSVSSDLKGIPERLSGALQQRPSHPQDSKDSYDDLTHGPGPVEGFPEVDLSDDVIINEHDTKTDGTMVEPVRSDEDFDLQTMFYLPKWRSASSPPSAKINPGGDKNLKVILANVEALLSQSPPSLIEHLDPDVTAPPLFCLPPFPVSFTLDLEDVDDDVMASDPEHDPKTSDSAKCSVGQENREIPQSQAHVEQSASKGKKPAGGLTWDAIFDDEDNEEENDCDDSKQVDQMDEEIKIARMAEENPSCGDDMRDEEVWEWTDGVKDDPQMDNSLDLFGDEEAFLQMTIPDVPTPGVSPRMSPAKQAAQNPCRSTEMHGDDAATNPTADALQVRAQTAQNTTDNAVTSDLQGQRSSFDKSHDLFSVNFDLGYSLDDSDEDREDDPGPWASASALPLKQADSSTPCSYFHKKPIQPNEPKLSTPQMSSEHRRRSVSSFFASPPKGDAFPSPITSTRARRIILPSPSSPRTPSVLSSLKRRRLSDQVNQESVCAEPLPPHPPECSSDSEDEVAVHKRRGPKRADPLASQRVESDVDSPVVGNRKRLAAFHTPEEVAGGALSDDDDFQDESMFTHRKPAAASEPVHWEKFKGPVRQKVRQFLDEEAELSEEDGGQHVSSDEEDGEELNHSLEGFVVNNTHCSQGLNDSEMHCVYLKSVRSPAVQGKFKMSYRNHHNVDIFSQVPEMDETYAEDSFVVGSEAEELTSSEEEAEDVDLLPEVSFVDGKRQYATRRRVFLHKAKIAGSREAAEVLPEQRAGGETKSRRIIRPNDSSEEETEEVCEKSLAAESGVSAPLWPKEVQAEFSRPQLCQGDSDTSAPSSEVSLLPKTRRVPENQQKERCRQRCESQHKLSDELDFVEPDPELLSKKQTEMAPATSSEPHKSESPAAPGPVCIVVDSRCLSSSVELVTSLRQRHAVTVHVCSLDGGYFIVSNRMAVERYSQSDMAALQNRKRLSERVKSLQGLFERICLIVEKERSKSGEASRPFQRTRCYDRTLISLVRTGVRLLWSNGVEDSACLLADLARLEQRKGQGISVPVEVKGQHREQALQLYLTLPSVNYVHALNMSHSFSSVAQLMNSSIEALQKGGCMSRSRAEEVYRFLRHSCDSFFMNTPKSAKKR